MNVFKLDPVERMLSIAQDISMAVSSSGKVDISPFLDLILIDFYSSLLVNMVSCLHKLVAAFCESLNMIFVDS